MNWYFTCIKRGLAFEGRARRCEFWPFFISYVLVAVGLAWITAVVSVPEIVKIAVGWYLLLMFLPLLSATVRRLHDVGKHHRWILLAYVPVLGHLWLLVILCRDGEPGDNRYGPWTKSSDRPHAKFRNDGTSEPEPGDEMTVMLPGGVPMTFCWCPATTSEAWKRISGNEDFFWMGSPETEKGRWASETRHRVWLTKGFWFGKFPVTLQQWAAVTGRKCSPEYRLDHPKGNVSWRDARKFVSQINAKVANVFSLPTEAQWEYACRAGTTTPFSFGKTRYGNMAAICYLAPNAWGICRLNAVSQWCADWYESYAGDAVDPVGPTLPPEDHSHVVRGGGSWYRKIMSAECRCACRWAHVRTRERLPDQGLRLVCQDLATWTRQGEEGEMGVQAPT